ncbi:hypothetical protein YN1_8140 [Nanoarchaeota archaeon]
MKREIIYIGENKVSLKQYIFILFLIALLGTFIYYILSQFLPNLIGILICSIVVAINLVYLNRYYIKKGLVIPTFRKRININNIFVLGDKNSPIDQEVINKNEEIIKNLDQNSKEYKRRLILLSLMYLQNSIVYNNKEYYDKAKEYLEKIDNFEDLDNDTKNLFNALKNKIEEYKNLFYN